MRRRPILLQLLQQLEHHDSVTLNHVPSREVECVLAGIRHQYPAVLRCGHCRLPDRGIVSPRDTYHPCSARENGAFLCDRGVLVHEHDASAAMALGRKGDRAAMIAVSGTTQSRRLSTRNRPQAQRRSVCAAQRLEAALTETMRFVLVEQFPDAERFSQPAQAAQWGHGVLRPRLDLAPGILCERPGDDDSFALGVVAPRRLRLDNDTHAALSLRHARSMTPR